MRNRLIVSTGALLLASATFATAQQTATSTAQQQAAVPSGAQSSLTPSPGFFDFGYRGFTGDGDEARAQRYRDLRNGAASRLVYASPLEEVAFEFQAENIGYHDQRYFANYDKAGTAKVSFLWDSIPLNYSYLGSSPWVLASEGETTTFTLDPAARGQVQNRAPGVLGIPSNAAQLGSVSIFRGLSRGTDIESRRDIAALAASVSANQSTSVNFTFDTQKRSGSQPFGMAFAFNNANELPMPLDNRTNNFGANVEWSNQQGMLTLGWDGSWFNNTIHDIVWDNPIRLTDTRPYDPSGYSNGNGPAQGRISMPPDTNMQVFSATGLYKMPGHTTINTNLAYGTQNQNDTLIPWTINPVIVPLMHPLERSTADAKVRLVNGLVNFTSRPNRTFGLNMRYRFNDHKNTMPGFNGEEYVRFDAVPEETGGEAHGLSIRQNTFDINGTFSVLPSTYFKIGYTQDGVERTHRAVPHTTDYTVRGSVDTIGNQYFSLRAQYERSVRRASEVLIEDITGAGGQPALRFFDEADRTRNKGTVLFTVTPVDIVAINFTVAAGKDKYDEEGQQFGLLDNDNTTYSIGLDLNPLTTVGFGASYGRDTFNSNQKSRNAQPAPNPTWTDPNFDWTLKNEERVNNVNVYLDLNRAIQNTDIRVSYDFSDSDNGFLFGGPRVAVLAALGTFAPLPNVTNQWNRLAADLKYYFTTRVGLGIGYWYEKFDISDFATVDVPGQPGTPRIDYLGGLITGYGNRPYETNTGFLRIIYLF